MIKRLIVMVATVVLLGGGGAATWLFFSKPEPSGEEPAAVVDPTFINIGALSIPVIRGGQVRKYVLLHLTLELVDRKAKALAEEAMPRLRDAFLQDLYGYFANQRSEEHTSELQSLMRISSAVFCL